MTLGLAAIFRVGGFGEGPSGRVCKRAGRRSAPPNGRVEPLRLDLDLDLERCPGLCYCAPTRRALPWPLLLCNETALFLMRSCALLFLMRSCAALSASRVTQGWAPSRFIVFFIFFMAADMAFMKNLEFGRVWAFLFLVLYRVWAITLRSTSNATVL